MDILFVHGNYPAQFAHLAPALAHNNRVVFLTNRKDPEVWQLSGVEVRRFDLHREASSSTHPYLSSTETAVLRGQAVVRAVASFLEEGFKPRLVLFHGGNGLGLFLRQLLPEARLINYVEWWFTDEHSRHLVADYTLDKRLRVSIRNSVILQELEICDVAVTPTYWQWQQFPSAYQPKIKILFDGVDCQLFKPRLIEGQTLLHGDQLPAPLSIDSQSVVLSYATRGMEPLRGFPEFMRMLPPLLEKFDNLKVVIAGQDRAAYSYKAPDHQGSWKQTMLSEISDSVGLDRVYFTGSLNYRDYQLLLCRTDLHVYFTRPYVTSWGLFQAAASGTHLMVNRDPATTYVLGASEAQWVNLDDPVSLVETATCSLTGAEERRNVNSVSKLRDEWQLPQCLMAWSKLLNQSLKHGTV